MTILLCLLSLGFLLSTPCANCFNIGEENTDQPYEKTIYVDVSLNNKLKNDGDNLYLFFIWNNYFRPLSCK